jgi:hypothetical protein
MLLDELPKEVMAALHIRVNAEKDTQVATRMVQRWRTPTNSISNTVGSTNEKLDLLISAPYADKLPLKAAELIRQDIPFAVLVPLYLISSLLLSSLLLSLLSSLVFWLFSSICSLLSSLFSLLFSSLFYLMSGKSITITRNYK